MIQVRPIETLDLAPDSRQELDRNFLHTGYRRRLYVASRPDFAWKSRPVRSRTPLTLVPIPLGGDGECRLTFLDGERGAVTVEMAAGRYYYIPPDVPYRVESRGLGAIEVFTPIPKNGVLFDEKVLPDDFFAAPTAHPHLVNPDPRGG